MNHSFTILNNDGNAKPAFPGAYTPDPITGLAPGVSATFDFTPTTAGDYTQCVDLACGAKCSECWGFGCWEAFCQADGLCHATPPPCAMQTLCYDLDPGEVSCGDAPIAIDRLCESCEDDGCVFYGVFLAVVVALVIGGKLAIDELDKGPAVNEDRAPWAQDDAEQRPPSDLDFPPSVTP